MKLVIASLSFDKDERVSYLFPLVYLAAKSSRMLAVSVFFGRG